jgi:hypothetical protein
MNSLRLMALLSLVLVATDAFTAQLKVINSGSRRVWVKTFWGPNELYLKPLNPGESYMFDSGLYSISLVRWIEEFPAAIGQTPGQMNVKSFDAAGQIYLNPVELGVTLDILNDGSFKVQKMLQQAKTGTATTLNGF